MPEEFEVPSSTPSAVDPAAVPVLLVDDHDIWRCGVRLMLGKTEFTLVGEARNAAEALDAARSLRPRIILLDIRLPDQDGIMVLTQLRATVPEAAVVMLTTYESPTFMARALAAGAVGYVLKGVTRGELLDTLRAVVAGENPLRAQELLRSLAYVSEQASLSSEVFQPFSRREEEVLRLVATGLPNRGIAQILGITEGTVKTHIEHILQKLGASSRIQLAVWAARHGFVPERPTLN